MYNWAHGHKTRTRRLRLRLLFYSFVVCDLNFYLNLKHQRQLRQEMLPYSSQTDLCHSIIRCPYSKCHARIISPKDVTKHSINTGIDYLKVSTEQTSDADKKFIKVADVWDFDNIGVSKSFDHTKESDVPLERLIICSECERGPLGFACFENGASDVKDLKYYLHLNSLLYEEEK